MKERQVGKVMKGMCCAAPRKLVISRGGNFPAEQPALKDEALRP